MLLIFILFSLIFLPKRVEAKSFSYQFIFTENAIDLDFFKAINLDPTVKLISDPVLNPSVSPLPSPSVPLVRILSFEYKIKQNIALPLDIPLFLITFDREVIFYADASWADDQFHRVEIDLSLFDLDIFNKTPIIYQNNYLSNFELEVRNLAFIESSFSNTVVDFQINDLSAIRELDKSLTIVFSLHDDSKRNHEYKLLCLSEKEEVLSSIKLNKNDDFLWTTFSFVSFFTNQKNELVFHLKEFNCDDLVRVIADQKISSASVFIVNVGDL